MLIVLEGTDGVGKSTLARALVDAVRRRHPDAVRRRHPDAASTTEVVKTGPPKRHPLLEYEELLWDYRPGTGRHLVLDRWHLGELVYPALLGRHTPFDHAMAAHVDMLLMSRGALLVWLTAHAGVVYDRVTTRGDDFVTPVQAVAAGWAFADAVQRASVDLVHVDTSPDARPVDHATLLDRAEGLERAATTLDAFTTYVGPPRPRILLLGDVRGVDGALATGPRPAFVPYRGTSGHYLLTALGSDACHSYRGVLGLANACDVDDPVELLDALRWRSAGGRQLPEVVALGRRAGRALATAGVDHRSVDHPQYVRRFHHHHGDAYRRHVFFNEPPKWRNGR